MLAVAVCAAATLVAAEPAAAAGCDLRGYRTVVEGSPVDVVRSARERAQSATYLACYGRRGRPLVLGDEYGDPGPALTGVTVNGRFVAVRLEACDRDGACESSVQVSDVRARRQELYRTDGIRNLLLTARGTVVAIAQYQGELSVITGSRGTETIVAQGTDIEPGSLAVAATRIYWIQGGEARTATFSG